MGEKISRREALFKALRFPAPAILSEEVHVKPSAYLNYRFPEGYSNTQRLAYEAVKLGILADKGVLFQDLGWTTPEVNVANANDIKTRPDIHYDIIATVLSADVVQFIKEESGLVNDDYLQRSMGAWFSKAMGLQKTVSDSETFVLKTDGEDFPLTSGGIDSAWERAGFADLDYQILNPGRIIITMPYPEN